MFCSRKVVSSLHRGHLLHRSLQYASRSLASRSHAALNGETVRIGCSSGFWGDTAVSANQLVNQGDLDFLVSDYLSEITMSLLVGARRKSPDLGYTPDFVSQIKPLLKTVKNKGIRLVTNAGGINPESCVQALKKLAESHGIELSIAMVTGDDLMSKIKEIKASGLYIDKDTKVALPSTVVSMNAYLGAFPIARALNAGADVVVTGRCVDSALALGPLVHKFGWKENDFDLLASGSLAGHLIECGAQATGGIFTDWDKVEGWDNIGFPVVECSSDGQFVITKPPSTGGVVSTGTVAEQMVYEIGDPCNYMLPDVSCDFSNVTLKQLPGDNEVLVSGAKGNPPTADYKVSTTYMDGYRATAVSPFVGPRAADKAAKNADAILKRTRQIFKALGLNDYTKTLFHAIGDDSSYGHRSETVLPGREAVMWLAVSHAQKEALEIFAREIAPGGTGMSPGGTALVGGRPRVSPILKLLSHFYPKDQLPVTVVKDNEVLCSEPFSSHFEKENKTVTHSESSSSKLDKSALPHSTDGCYMIGELAYLRSGDKGDSANIGVIARRPEYLPYLREHLTEAVVAKLFGHFLEPSENETSESLVHRYELPGIHALNFVLEKSLGGGGVSSLRVDPQGKAYGQMLADYEIGPLY